LKFRQFADVKDAAAEGKGQVFHWNVYSDVATQGTTVKETTTTPETNGRIHLIGDRERALRLMQPGACPASTTGHLGSTALMPASACR
jgi:hypothetical protein